MRRESILEDSNMLMPLDPATLPRKVTALRSLLLQREAEHTAERAAPKQHPNWNARSANCKPRATDCKSRCCATSN